MLHVTLRQLRVFDAVARQLSFTRAARELHLTQPAVSMQIKQLEDRAGLALFEQIGKRIFLTEAGHEMQRYGRSIARQLDELGTVLDGLRGLKSGRLAISVASTANYFAPQLLAAFWRRFPAITVSLDVTNREALLRQLAENEVDMVIMGQPPQGLSLTLESFAENPLVVIAAPDHSLATARRIPLKRLQRETFLMREHGSGTRIAMERFFAHKGITLTTGTEMSSNEAIKQAVGAGMGLGIVSLHTLELELQAQRLKVLDVQGFPIVRHWYVVHPEDKRLSASGLAFKGFLLEEAAKLMRTAHAAPSLKRL
ncbi:MAG: LysR family transcriptional regulator [Burkholderiales bacterium]